MHKPYINRPYLIMTKHRFQKRDGLEQVFRNVSLYSRTMNLQNPFEIDSHRIKLQPFDIRQLSR